MNNNYNIQEKDSFRPIFLGVADDKSQQYPYCINKGLRASLDNIIVANALLSPPIIIEEGFLVASQEILSLGESSRVMLDAISAGLLKIMSRSGNLLEYSNLRRALNHTTLDESPENLEYLRRIQEICERQSAFVPYPEPNIDRITFRRLSNLCNQSYVSDLLKNNGYTSDAFFSMFQSSYHYGLNGEQWTARSAWEHAASLCFKDNSRVTHAMMSLANRQRQLIRAAALADLVGQEVVVETGLDFGGYDLIESGSQIISNVAIRSFGRREILKDIPFHLVQSNYRIFFNELIDVQSNIYQAKQNWLWCSLASEGNFKADTFEQATLSYIEAIQQILHKNGISYKKERSSSEQMFIVSSGLVAPASFLISNSTLGGHIDRRIVLRAILGGFISASIFLARPWAKDLSISGRSRLLVAQSKITEAAQFLGDSVLVDNCHERLVISPKSARSGLFLKDA